MSASEQLTIAIEQPADHETEQPASLYQSAETLFENRTDGSVETLNS